MTIFFLLAGLVLLTIGAEILVRGASQLATVAGISPLIVGLTIVAFGTSAPELVVSLQSSWAGKSDVALGNVVGSNIFNVLFILGISALIVPLRVDQRLIWFEVPLMIGLSVLVWLMGLDGRIGQWEGLALVLGLVSYTGWAIVQSRRESAAVKAEYRAKFSADASEGLPAEKGTSASALTLSGLFVLVGLALLVLGSRWFVSGAVSIAQNLNVSELVIGITIVAAGTSLPEVATSIMAALRGERDIAVGNVVGSNLFNILAVLGLSSLFSPAQGISVSPAAMQLDIPVMIAVALACLPVFFTGHLIARWEGAVFLAYYVAYTSYLILLMINPGSSSLLGTALVGFVIPLTILTFAVCAWRSRRQPVNQD